jgi:hypothetical protein
VQFRSKAFNPEVAAARLDSLGDAELERLIDDYVREEALHREALALGMDQNDYVIKQRLIQSLQFITNGFVSAAVDVSDEEIAEYYEANRDDRLRVGGGRCNRRGDHGVLRSEPGRLLRRFLRDVHARLLQ